MKNNSETNQKVLKETIAIFYPNDKLLAYPAKNAINNDNSMFNNVKSKTNKSSNNINNIQVNKYLKDLSENASLEYNDDIMKKTTPKQKNKFNKKNPNNEILNDKINFNNINIGINNNNFIIDNNNKGYKTYNNKIQ